MTATLQSRLPAIVAGLRPRVSAAVKAGAEVIAEDARELAPDAPPQGEGLVEAIHVENVGPAEYAVIAGDDDVFYGHMVEFGTSHSAAHPFLIPATEANRSEAARLVTVALRAL